MSNEPTCVACGEPVATEVYGVYNGWHWHVSCRIAAAQAAKAVVSA